MRAGSEKSQGWLEGYDELHRLAEEATGLSDFGAPEYRENLKFLLRCYDDESRLGEEGVESTRATLVNCLKSRLYSVARLAANEECLAAPLVAPLVIMGLPRTGTTALHKLLAADPASQSLEYWLGCQPDVRPPREEWPAHPGYQEASASLARIYAHSPEIESIHSMQPDEADECRLLFLQDFLGLTFSSNATLPSYQEWLLGRDMRGSYLRYRDNLKLIGAREPDKRWVLKNSSHLWAMEALQEGLPGCCIVQTHRNPVELIPSISSLVYRMRRISEPKISKEEVGRQQLDVWARILDKNMDSRRSTQGPILDVHFESFTKNSIATFKRIYAFFDFEWSEESEASIAAWAENNRQHQHGTHDYSAEEYGLSDAMIAERFVDYIEWQEEIRRTS